jgi:NADH:ubiquinone oxidoreductase subunit B-like Fe-S oxidoreductase
MKTLKHNYFTETVFVEFDVLIAVSTPFWIVTTCCSIEIHRRFGGTYPFRLWGSMNKPSNEQYACHMIVAAFLLGLLSESGDGSDTFTRSVGELLPNCAA